MYNKLNKDDSTLDASEHCFACFPDQAVLSCYPPKQTQALYL